MEAATRVPAPGRLVLWGRAAVLGTVALACGAVSHAAAGGLLPHPLVIAALLVSAVLGAAGFLRVRASAARLVLLVVTGQTATHMLLSGLAGHRGETSPAAIDFSTPVVDASSAERTGSLFDHYTRTYGAGVPSARGTGAGVPEGWLGHQLDHLTAQGPLMVLSHVGGAVALGLFLAVGERALWSLLLLLGSQRHVSVAGWRLVLLAAHVRGGVELAGSCLQPLVARPGASQVPGRGAPRRRGPPLLLAA